MDAKKKTRQVADEECILDAAEIVLGDEYADHRPFDHLGNPAVVAELLRAGFTHAEARTDRYRSALTTFRLG